MYHKWESPYDVWFLRYVAWWTEFFVILDHFLAFYSPKPKKKHIILHKCTTKNYHNHMLYYSWDKALDGCNCYFSFWFFLPFYTPKKSKFQKNEKNSWRYHHFSIVYQKLWSDDVRFVRYGAWQTNRQTEKVTYRGGWTT